MAKDAQLRVAKSRHDYKPAPYRISHIDLAFELDPKATKVTAVMQVIRQVTGEPLRLDGQELKLLYVAVNGVELAKTEYLHDDESLTIIEAPEQFELTVITQIAPAENTALEGLYLAGDSYCTQCEAEGFRRITYFFDRPDVLAEYTVMISANAEHYPYLLSNGNKVSETVNESGVRTVKWHDPFPKPSYLFALVAGDFDLLVDKFITASGRHVDLQLFVDKGQAARGDFALQALKRAMRWDEQRFNLEYDLDIYMVVATDFFNMGAMENKGLNVFNSKYVLADAATATDRDYFNIESIIGHEYFHNWTGNRVTCRDWFQLSLKEGLTVFRDQEFSADMGSPTLCRIDAIKLIKTAQFAEDAGPMAHPIRPDSVLEMNNFYTVTVYDKGAEVIRMLQTILGKEGFNKGLAIYLQRFDGQAATCDDFVQAMQDANQRDLSHFALWYSQSGTPELTVSQHYDAQAKRLTLTLAQQTPATADQATKQPLLLPVSVEFLLADDTRQTHLLLQEKDKQQFIFDHIEANPIVVWLNHFSAPVKLAHETKDDELLYIAANASDGVARWDAMQQFWSRKVRQLVTGASIHDVIPPQLYSVFAHWLSTPQTDLALTAELLTLPDFDTLAEQYEQIPVDGILRALEQLRQLIAEKLENEITTCYQRLSTAEPYLYAPESVGRRSLQAVCLGYMALRQHNQQLLRLHYKNADNMTDCIAALKAAQLGLSDVFTELITDLANRWQHDSLVMDKAFSLIATTPSEDVFNAIEKMQEHALFSWNNPNRVRALYSAFSMKNPQQFHRLDGKGYMLLQQVVAKLDAINPQVAARLVTPLLSWKRYEVSRQRLMQAALQQLAAIGSLSNDVFEKVNRSLQ